MAEIIKLRDLRRKDKFQIDDAYLNGYARLCGIYATGVYCSLCRHANYTTQKCWPSIDKIAEELNINRKTVLNGIAELEKWGIISTVKEKDQKTKRQLNNTYLLTDKSEWKPKPDESRVPVADSEKAKAESVPYQKPSPSGGKSRVPVADCKVTKNTKVTNIKDIAADTAAVRSDQDIVDVIEAFKIVNSSYRKYFGNTSQRAAADRLIEVHGKDKVINVISILTITNTHKYAPKIYTPCQLEDNWDRLKDHCLEVKNNQSKTAVYEPKPTNNR